MALCNIPSLQRLDLAGTYLGSAELAELAPALHRSTSMKVLDISGNSLNNMESAELLRGIIRRNETITTLNLSRSTFGQTTGAVECITDGLGSNSTLLKIDLSWCRLGDAHVSILVKTLFSGNTTLRKVILGINFITSTYVGVPLEMMEHKAKTSRISTSGTTLLGTREQIS
jgi:Ran GTPase-activating protein (RanGAP) involved in mRNA processing and transport